MLTTFNTIIRIKPPATSFCDERDARFGSFVVYGDSPGSRASCNEGVLLPPAYLLINSFASFKHPMRDKQRGTARLKRPNETQSWESSHAEYVPLNASPRRNGQPRPISSRLLTARVALHLCHVVKEVMKSWVDIPRTKLRVMSDI